MCSMIIAKKMEYGILKVKSSSKRAHNYSNIQNQSPPPLPKHDYIIWWCKVLLVKKRVSALDWG